MVIFGNMQVLSFLSRFLTSLGSLRYQNGYYGCGGSQRYHYGRCAMLKCPFVSTKVRLRRNKSKGKKKWKNEKSRVKKYTLFKIDAKIFSSIKKYKKSNAIGYARVCLFKNFQFCKKFSGVNDKSQSISPSAQGVIVSSL